MAIEYKADLLNHLEIATPCRANWQDMEKLDAEGRARFCRACHKNVYDISLMAPDEATTFLQQHEDARGNNQQCRYLFERADGSILISDCPVGSRSVRRSKGVFTVLLALIVLMVPSPVSRGFRRITAWTFRHIPIVAAFEQTKIGRAAFLWLDAPEPNPQEFRGGGSWMNS